MSEPGDSSSMPFDSDDHTPWDGIVIGAGPAGAMAARQLALAGRRVLLVEKKRFPRWKICGACLNGQALAALRSAGLGSLVDTAGSDRTGRFHVGFRGRTARLGMPEGVALSRPRLDAALVEAATAAGVQFLEETHAALERNRGGVRRVRLMRHGRFIEVDGPRRARGHGPGESAPRAARWQLKTNIRPGSRIGAGCVIADAPRFYRRADDLHGGWPGRLCRRRPGRGRQLERRGGVRAGSRSSFGDAGTGRGGDPGRGWVPARSLASTMLHWQGTAGLTRRTRPLAQERLFVLGDAAGYVEPFTGEGIAWALASGHAVAPLALEAMERWDPRLARAWSKFTAGWSAAGKSSVARSRWACASPGWRRSALRS